MTKYYPHITCILPFLLFLIVSCSAKEKDVNKLFIELKNEVNRAHKMSPNSPSANSKEYSLYYVVPDTLCWRCTSSEFLGRWFVAGNPVERAIQKTLVIFTTGKSKSEIPEEYSQYIDSLPTITIPYSKKYESFVGKVILANNKDSKILSSYNISKGEGFKQAYRTIDSILFENYLYPKNNIEYQTQVGSTDTLHYLQNAKDLAVHFNDDGKISFYSNRLGKAWLADSLGVKMTEFDFRDVFKEYDKKSRLDPLKFIFTSNNTGVFYYIRDFDLRDTIINNVVGRIFNKNEGIIGNISINLSKNTISSKKIPINEDRHIITILKSSDDSTVWLINTVPPDVKKDQKTFYIWKYNQEHLINKDEYEHKYEIFTDRTICANGKQLFLFSMGGKITRYTDGNVLEYESSYYHSLGNRILTEKIGDNISIHESSDSLSYVVAYNAAGVRETDPISVPKNSIAIFSKDLQHVICLTKYTDSNKKIHWILTKRKLMK